jgi:hypothetical protein
LKKTRRPAFPSDPERIPTGSPTGKGLGKNATGAREPSRLKGAPGARDLHYLIQTMLA